MDPLTPAAQPNPTQPTPAVPPTTATPAVQPKSGLINPNKIYQARTTENLVSPTIVMADKGSSVNPWKAIVLDVLTIIFAGAFGYAFARYLAGSISFWFVFAALLLWGAASVIEGFLQKSFSRRFLVLFFESLALIAFFYDYAWQALALTGILVLLCLVWGYWSVRRQMGNSVEIRFFAASGKVMGKVITAAVIFMIVMYASLANDRGNFFVSESGFNDFFTWAAGFINNFYPTVPLNGSVGDFAQAVARMQLQGNQQFQSLAPTEQNAVLAQSANQIIDALANGSSTAATSTSGAVATSTAITTATSSATTTPMAATEPTSNAFYDYFAAQLQKLQTKFNTIFIGAWGLALFLILRSIGIIVVWVAQFISLIFYELLLASGFMKIKEHASSQEVIEY